MPDESTILRGHNERMERIMEVLKRKSLREFRPLERLSPRQLRRKEEIRMFGRELLSPSEELQRQIMKPVIAIR